VAGVEPALLRAGSWNEVTPELAGWRWLSFELKRMPAGAAARLGAPDRETAGVLLSGSAAVAAGPHRWKLARRSVFDGPPWAVYVPAGEAAEIEARTQVELAIVGSRSDRVGEARLVTPDEIRVEIRGAGSATRQINHVLPPESPADRLLVVEVLTPSGNWSSYPPHKHDENRPPNEVELEEFYYFRVRPRTGFGFLRVYSPRHSFDLTAAVRDGDVVLVPYGYHVCGAPHGIDVYYLNGLAGDVRSMAASDDPDFAYIRDTWEDMETDRRLPIRPSDYGGER